MSAYPLTACNTYRYDHIEPKVNIMYIIRHSTMPVIPRGKTADPLLYKVEGRWSKAGGAYPMAVYQVIDLSWALGLYPWRWGWLSG